MVNICSQAFDESISAYLQLADLLCFSSQYYFVISFTSYAIFLLMISFSIMLRQNWMGTFGDQFLGVMLVAIVGIYKVRE